MSLKFTTKCFVILFIHFHCNVLLSSSHPPTRYDFQFQSCSRSRFIAFLFLSYNIIIAQKIYNKKLKCHAALLAHLHAFFTQIGIALCIQYWMNVQRIKHKISCKHETVRFMFPFMLVEFSPF